MKKTVKNLFHFASASSHDAMQPTSLLWQAELEQLNSSMNDIAKEKRWLSYLKDGGDAYTILLFALTSMASILQSTPNSSLKDRMVDPKVIAARLLDNGSLSSEEKTQWSELLKNILRQGNWEQLIEHRPSFLPFFSTSPLICHLAIMKVPSPSASSRIRRARLLNGEVQRE
jgi:hypothetical protein